MNTAVTNPVPGRRELRKQERRQAVIQAARASFLEHGYAATSMSGLLDTLGGSKGTLWGYFRSKEDLFAAVIVDATAQVRADLSGRMATDEDLAQGLHDFCRSFLRTVESPEDLAVWRLIVAEGNRFPELGRIFYEQVARFPEEILTDFLAKFVGRELRDEDPRRMALMLISLCAGRHYRLVFGVEPASLDSIDVAAAEFVDLFLRAYGLQPV
jgi:TetR/AcrR family transcriptional regulator, mexJK operon transcriptional repressor